ncbi:interferon gamma receptor 1 [Sebastes umbrosus]|uniref:interferon gamma receptor 1 n=1 Tax=Sebastes umbrosus TaxID=72105 RepID=UPI0018A0964B|nr:interferon gamma receptor 1 [Sebastes umbrosus]XP_037620473.1 interferon gamma receptor 1 [Sebastes umbrosus]
MLLNGNGVFTVLLLITGVSTGIVLPPANVTLSCSNLNVTVSWDYSKPQPQTSFRVHIGGSAGEYVNETTEHRYDLSHFIWASEDRYTGFHFVTLTAIEGGNQSEPVTSKTFTFNYLKPAHIKCELDFPPVDVDVNEKDSGVTVSFMNPLFFYRELKQAVKPDTASFQFTVSGAGDFERSCSAQQENCKSDIVLPDNKEKCVRLKGLLFAGNGVGQVQFRETGRICASKYTGKYTDVYIITLAIGLLVLAIVIGVIIIIICKVKAWTMDIPSQPKPLIIDPLLPNHRGLKYVPVSPTDISAVNVSVNKPCKNPSVSSEEDNDLQDVVAGFGSQPPDMSCAEEGLQEGYLRDDDSADDSADDSVKTEIVLIVLEEEEVSPYDRPHALQMDMGDGDMVTGYIDR